ncbi:cache domain-containing protein [Desulfobacterales bacterium HSG16]|nr:cache domain-containing protein [Desulfobacterales bacterium HSG16]
MTRLTDQFHKLSIRNKLIIGYSSAFFLAILIGGLVIFTLVRRTIESSIESELTKSTDSILNMVKTVTDASIKNRLRAVAEKNHEIIYNLHNKYKKGIISEAEAKEKAEDILLSQKIGKTGYIYIIDSKGIIKVHPSRDLHDSNLSKYDFIQHQMKSKEGYIEYDWANPGEKIKRPKALYMSYFGPWDWIISASSYRNEFRHLFDVKDFQQSILSITFGKTGYSYVIDSKGNLVIHPKLNTNIYESKDANGRMFIKEICEKKTGKIIYPWKNPGEVSPREKLVIFNYIKELDWIVASSSYLEEIHAPLKIIKYTIVAIFCLMLCLVFPLTWWISLSIIQPLQKVMNGFSSGIEGNFSKRLDMSPIGGEIGMLADYYNKFMCRLEDYNNKLIESEKNYRSIFENAVEGIFRSSPKGKFISSNPSGALLLGYSTPGELIRNHSDIAKTLYVDPTDRDIFIRSLEKHNVITSFETRLYNKNKKIVWVCLNARAVRDDMEDIAYIEGFMTDITERKQMEDAMMKSHTELEQKIKERTAELSARVKELEQHNIQANLLRNFSEMLQACQNIQETYTIIEKYISKFFPDDSGIIFKFSRNMTTLNPALSWGDPLMNHKAFTKNDCWALRQGKPYLVNDSDNSLCCTHISQTPSSGYFCVPMIAPGKGAGLIYLQFSAEKSDIPTKQTMQSKAMKQHILITIAEHLALAQTNLELRESLLIQSMQDQLTGLYNRHYLRKTLETKFTCIKDKKSSMGIIMIDIDNFKNFNDTYGHTGGDAVLHSFGTYLKKKTGDKDIACRYGGEEFMLILLDRSLEKTHEKAEEICSYVRNKLKIDYNGRIHSITISMGVAEYPDHGETVEDIIKAADTALYQAKANGRDQVIIANDNRIFM